MPGEGDTYVAYGENWANVSNTPFRLYKHFVHEGGISTPLVAHWPKGIARKGELEPQPGHLIDVMATCVDLSGATYPTERNGKAVTAMEGRSLAPAFAGKLIDRDAIYWEHEGNRAVRAGKWKLVAKGRDGPWELYDIDADRTEMHDLASTRPEKARELAAKWDAYAKRANVLPYPNEAKAARPDGKPNPKRSFDLKPGDDLSGGDAPAVADRGLTVSADVTPTGKTGVILAHGGAAVGYALYLKDGRPTFAVRTGGKLTTAAAKDPLPPGQPAKLRATLAAGGALTLHVGGSVAATGKAPGLLVKAPVDGLQVGRDEAGPVGEYTGPNPFDGTIGAVRVELAE
jgi:arylsulfatase